MWPTDTMEAACKRLGLLYVATSPDDIVGVANSVVSGAVPLNGLRHPPGRTSGWFLWGGADFSSDQDFFKPLHAKHLVQRCPEIILYLGLPPGSRFVMAPGHEDVWTDPALLDHVV